MSKITTVSPQLLLFLEGFEKFESKPYLCPAGVPTIGFGTTFYFDTKKAVTLKDKPITIEEARRLKSGHINSIFAPMADKLCRDDLKQNEFDAVVSFLYNAGPTYKDKHGKNQYYNIFNNINVKMPAKDLRKYWEGLAVTGAGKKLPGLIRRRKRESEMFIDNTYNSN
jgi:lysozyme